MSDYRGINIALFLSLIFHSIILYPHSFKSTDPLSEKRAMKVLFEIERPEAEQKVAVEREMNIKPKPLPKVEVPVQRSMKEPKVIEKKDTLKAESKRIEVVTPSEKKRPEEVKGHPLETSFSQELPTPEIPGEGVDTFRRFRTMVLGRIEKEKIYPKVARRMGIEGEVFLRFSILPDGKVNGIEVIPPTATHKALEIAAIKTIKGAAPYLPVPLNLQKEDGVKLDIRLSYRLN